MTTNYHDPIEVGESNDPSTVNTRLSDLDSAIVSEASTRASAIIAEAAARIQGDNTLEDTINALVLGSGTSQAETIAARTAIRYGTAPTVLADTIEYAAGGVFNVQAYGAVADGTTDDTTAINAAITAANTAGGGVVLFPPGTYAIGTAAGITVLSNVWLRGEGATLFLKNSTWSTSNTTSGLLNMATDSRVTGLTINGNRTNQTGKRALIMVNNKDNVIIDHCKVYSGTLFGICVIKGENVDVQHNTVYDIYTPTISSGFGNDATGICVQSNDGSNTFRTVAFNTVYNCGIIGIDVRQTAYNVHVIGNMIYNIGVATATSIGLQTFNKSDYCVVANNYIAAVPGGTGTTGWPVSIDQAVNTVVSGNVVKITTASNLGIEIVACQDCTIANNVIDVEGGSVNYAIICDRSSFCTFDGNIISSESDTAGAFGFRSQGTAAAGLDPDDWDSTTALGCWYNVYSNNVVRNFGDGFYITAYSFQTTISNNVVRIRDASTGRPISVFSGEVNITGNTLYSTVTTNDINGSAIMCQYTSASASFPVKDIHIVGNRIDTAKRGIGMYSSHGTITNVNISGNTILRNSAASGTTYPFSANGASSNVRVSGNLVGSGFTDYRESTCTYANGWSFYMDDGALLTGTTATRPANMRPGYMYYDTTLSKPIWWNGTNWKDATGTNV